MHTSSGRDSLVRNKLRRLLRLGGAAFPLTSMPVSSASILTKAAMMSVARCVALRVVLLAAAAVVHIALGINVPCDSGTRVYSLSAYHGHWLDGIEVVCTGGGQEYIPSNYNLEVGDGQGGLPSDAICAGTAGVESIEWFQVDASWVIPSATTIMVNVTISCADGSTQTVANA